MAVVNAEECQSRYFLKVFVDNIQLNFPYIYIKNPALAERNFQLTNPHPTIPVYQTNKNGLHFELIDFRVVPIDKRNCTKMTFPDSPIHELLGGDNNYYISAGSAMQYAKKNPSQWFEGQQISNKFMGHPLQFVFQYLKPIAISKNEDKVEGLVSEHYCICEKRSNNVSEDIIYAVMMVFAN